MRHLHELLGIQRGVTAVIGSGGKTGLLEALSRTLPGTVILTTTTRILPFPDMARLLFAEAAKDAQGPSAQEREEAALSRLRDMLSRHRVVCTGTLLADGKLTAPPALSRMKDCADYVIAEADGARGKPLKAHAAHEPVIPDDCSRVICVIGASGFGKRVREAVHRPEIFCALLNGQEGAVTREEDVLTPESIVTPEMAGAALFAERLSDTLFVNQTDDDAMIQAACACAKAAGVAHACYGSIHRGQYHDIGVKSHERDDARINRGMTL